MPGHGYLYFPNGDLHEGEFVDGRMHGKGTMVMASGTELTGGRVYVCECVCMCVNVCECVCVSECVWGCVCV